MLKDRARKHFLAYFWLVYDCEDRGYEVTDAKAISASIHADEYNTALDELEKIDPSWSARSRL